jgi:hypothetical protein
MDHTPYDDDRREEHLCDAPPSPAECSRVKSAAKRPGAWCRTAALLEIIAGGMAGKDAVINAEWVAARTRHVRAVVTSHSLLNTMNCTELDA